MTNRSYFVTLLLILLSAIALAQPFVIDGATVVGKGGRSQTFIPANRARPGDSFEDWWYDDEVNCIRRTGCVDIVFVMDTSGSMSSAISSLQDEIYRFAYDLHVMGFEAGFGYVTYCETVNFPHGSTFITDIDVFAGILSGSRAGAGALEATTDGLYYAVRDFNWRDGCEQVAIVITDECDDDSERTPGETLALLADWGGTVYFMSADCRDVTIYRQYVDATGGIWFNYFESDLSEIFDFVIDEIAEVEEINVTITNTSGGTLDLITAEIIPDFCLMVGDSPNPVSHGPISSGASHMFAWDIEEVPACFGWGDCFMIRVTSGSYADSIVGCVWVEDCGCPGPEAWVICPEARGNWTACHDQYFEIQYEGYLGVNPNTLCIRVDGVEHCYPSSSNLTWYPGGRGGVLRFTPSPPGWSHLQTVRMETVSGLDVTDCPQLFHPFSDFKTDLRPPKPVWWEHFPATWLPPRPARREVRDGAVSFYPPCGSTLDSTDHIIISALLYDDGAGLTPLDDILRDVDLSLIEELDFIGIWEGLTSVRVTVNDIPFIPGVPYPGHFSRTVDLDITTYLLNPSSWFGGWEVACTIRADTASILGLAFLFGGEIEICLHAHDMVRASGCMPCTNDTSWCCTYYIAGSIPLVANAGPDQYICTGSSVVIGGTPAAGGGTEPYSYSWSPTTGLSNPNIANPTASPTVTTTYTLTVTDGDSETATDDMTVYVSNPTANAGRDTTFCPGGYVQLGGSPTASGGFAPYTYSWSPTTGLSSPTTANPMFTSGWVTSDTTITFTVTVTDTLGCIATDEVTVTVSRIEVDAGEDRRICVGDVVTLGGSPTAEGGVPPYNYSWTATPPGAVFSTEANPVVTPTDTTLYVVMVTGGDPSCTSYDSVWVYPVEPVADAGRDTIVCGGEELILGGDPTASGGIPPYTYYWTSIPPAFTSTVPNPSISPNNPIHYVVQVIDSLGCEAWDTVFVDVAGTPFGRVVRPFPCGGISSCEYQEIIWIVTDTTSALEVATLELLVDGTPYFYASPEVDVFEMDDSIRVTFTPSLPWMHGSTIVFELVRIENAAGCAGYVEVCEFIVDIHPPLPDPPVPPDGSVLYSAPDSVGVFIADEPAGVDVESFDHITVMVNGIPAVGWTTLWDGSYLSFVGLDIESGDSVLVCLDNLYDAPTYDYCPPNDTSFCWWFMVLPCDLDVAAYPDTFLCGGGVVPLVVDAEGGSGFISYSWTPTDGLDDPTSPTPTALVDSSINYTVRVTDDSLDCYVTDVVRIVVSNPVAHAGDDGLVCPFAEIPLGDIPTATGGFEPYVFEWLDLGGTLLYSEANPIHAFGDVGETFVLRVVDSLGCEAWDTVTFTIEYESPLAIDLIAPTPDDTLLVGETTFEWAPDPAHADMIYDFIFDGTVLFSGIDSTHVTIEFPCGETHEWMVVGVTECIEAHYSAGETTWTTFADTLYSEEWIFHTEDCTEPHAIAVHVPNGDWTACDPDSIIAFIIDTTEIVESSIVMAVNGVSYRTSDPQLEWDGDSTLVFRPATMWADGEVISVCVDSAVNIDDIPLVAPVCWEFYIDRSAPIVVSAVPAPGSEISPMMDNITICVRDELSGLDSVYIEVYGDSYTFGPFACVDTVVCFDIALETPLPPGDTIDVAITRMTDCPDWCGPNVGDSAWVLIVSDCELIVSARPDTNLCAPDSVNFDAIVSHGTGAYSFHWFPEAIFADPFAQNPTGWVSASGWVRVEVTDDSSWCVAQDSVRIVVSELAINAGEDGRVCPGAILTLGCAPTASGGIEPYSYSWRVLGGAEFSTLPNPDWTFGSSSVSIILTVTDAIGCVAVDTVNFTVDYEPITGINLIEPLADAEESPGEVLFRWAPVPAGAIATYEFYVDGVLISTQDSTRYAMEFPCGEAHDWQITGYTDCIESFVYCGVEFASEAFDTAESAIRPFTTSPCGVPSASYRHVPTGDWTACDPDSIVWRIVDTVGIDPTSIVVRVNGTRYTTADAELTFMPAIPTSRLRFDPSPMWPSGTTVNACLDSLMNLDSIWLPAPVCGEFYVDLDPPVVWGIAPAPGSMVIAASWTSLDFKIYDYLSGLDGSSVEIEINSNIYTLSSPDVTWDGDSLVLVDITGLGIDCDETIVISIGAGDSPDWCGPNWFADTFTIFTAPCGLTPNIVEPLPNTISACDDQSIIMTIVPVGELCPIDASSIVLRVEGVDYTVADGELDWSPDTLLFTPSTLWNHGDTVNVCLMAVDDECGAELPSPVCWEFFVDLQAPVRTAIDPPCGRPLIPGMNDHWTITLTDDVAGILPGATSITLDGVSCPIDGPEDIRERVFTFEWNPSDCGITLTPGDTIELCILTSDGPMDYCEPFDTMFCCYYPIIDTGGPVATIVRVRPDSISACDPESIIVELTSAYPIVEPTIVLNVDGTSYTTASPRLEWLDPFLVYHPDPDWNPHDTVHATVVSAEDIFGNPCVNAPLSWTFYIDRVPPMSDMIEPPPGAYTRNIRQEILLDVDDELAGVNPNTLVLVIDGVTYYYGDFEWSGEGLGGIIRWIPDAHGIEFNAGDTVFVSLTVEDSPDYCGPNIHIADYMFVVEPATPCLVVPNPFTPDGDNINEIAIFDWPNMTTEGATIYIFTIRNVPVRKFDVPAQEDYFDVVSRAWDGRDDDGKLMPQGLYLYLIESDGRIVCNGTITLLR